MAPQSTKSLAHFMHPPHRLTECTTNTTYHCDGCKMAGTGTRFSCTICKFNMHDYCAKCPTWLTSTTNHPHRLTLFVYRPKLNHTQPCQICQKPVQGLAYQCKGCNFLVHPICVSLGGSGSDSERIDSEDVVELGTILINEKVSAESSHFSYGTSNASAGYDQVPSSGGSGSNDGGIFEAIIRGIGHMFEASSA